MNLETMEQLIWILVEFTFASISVVLANLFVRSFLKQETNPIFNRIGKIVIVTAFALKFLTNLYFSENIIIISSVTIITAFSLGKFYFRDKLAMTIMTAVFAFISGAIAELLAGVIITGFRPISLEYVMQFGIYRIQARTLSLLFLLIIIILIRQFRKSSMSAMNNRLVFSLCILPLSSILIAQQFMIHVIDTASVTTINEVIPMLSIVIVNVFIFILVENIMRQHERSQELLLIKAQSDIQQQHISQLINNHEQIRLMSHDFKHQVDVLHQLCEGKCCNELKNTLMKLSNRHNATLLVKTGNTILDTILSSKKEDAIRQNIKFDFNLIVKPELSYMSMDIYVLMGNAIDNAIEACVRSNAVDRFIKVDLTANSSCFQLHIKNSIGNIPQVRDEFLQTQKNDRLRHGIGLKSIKQISKKLGGDMTYEYDDEQFEIWIYLTV